MKALIKVSLNMIKVGDIMVLKDHINLPGFACQHPLRQTPDWLAKKKNLHFKEWIPEAGFMFRT
jgi:purine nucleoside phosphorylase